MLMSFKATQGKGWLFYILKWFLHMTPLWRPLIRTGPDYLVGALLNFFCATRMSTWVIPETLTNYGWFVIAPAPGWGVFISILC